MWLLCQNMRAARPPAAPAGVARAQADNALCPPPPHLPNVQGIKAHMLLCTPFPALSVKIPFTFEHLELDTFHARGNEL